LSAEEEKDKEDEEEDFLESEESGASVAALVALEVAAGCGSSCPFTFEEKAATPDATRHVARDNLTVREGAKKILFIAPPPCAARAP
jgi:hypothetical protein